jgi:hypothetical protein
VRDKTQVGRSKNNFEKKRIKMIGEKKKQKDEKDLITYVMLILISQHYVYDKGWG